MRLLYSGLFGVGEWALLWGEEQGEVRAGWGRPQDFSGR